MSKNLSAVAVTEFDSMVAHLFQSAGKLRSTVSVRTGVRADIYNFRRMGKGLANQKPSQADVTPMDVSHTLVPATLSNWNAPEYTDIFDSLEVNFDEKMELAKTIANALGRRMDQLVIDALDTLHANSGSYAGQVTNDIGGTDSNMNVDKLIRASRFLNANGVPSEGRHVAISAFGLEGLLNTTEATSTDYNSVKALVRGEIDTFMGFKVHVIEDRDEGGLAKDGSNDRTCFAWHESAVGLAIGMDPRTSIDWIAQKTSWLANGMMKAGAVVRDATGVVEIICREA